MNEFIRFDPFIHASHEANLIKSLKEHNTILTLCLIGTLCVAGYYAYHYYQSLEELD